MKTFVNLFCLFLVVLGVCGALYWIYYRWIMNKYGFQPGFQFFLGLLVTILVGFATTYIGIYFSEQSSKESIKEFQVALYPDDFSLSLQPEGIKEEWCKPSEHISTGNAHILLVKEKDKPSRIRIRNNSKYPANNVRIGFFINQVDFKEQINDLKQSFENKWGLKVFDSDPILTDNKEELTGFQVLIDHMEEKGIFNIGMFNLTLKKSSGLVAIKIRKKYRLFKIEVEGKEKKQPSDIKSNFESTESGVTPIMKNHPFPNDVAH